MGLWLTSKPCSIKRLPLWSWLDYYALLMAHMLHDEHSEVHLTLCTTVYSITVTLPNLMALHRRFQTTSMTTSFFANFATRVCWRRCESDEPATVSASSGMWVVQVVRLLEDDVQDETAALYFRPSSSSTVYCFRMVWTARRTTWSTSSTPILPSPPTVFSSE